MFEHRKSLLFILHNDDFHFEVRASLENHQSSFYHLNMIFIKQDLCNGLYVRSINNNGFSFSESPLSFQFINRFLEAVDHKSRIALLFVVYTIYHKLI